MPNNTEIRKIFTENLNRLFDEKGASQRELAKYMGVSAPTVNDWLKGRVVPRMDKVDRLCTYFMVNRSALLEKKRITPANSANSFSDQEYIEKYQSLSSTNKAVVNQLIDNLVSIEARCQGENAGA